MLDSLAPGDQIVRYDDTASVQEGGMPSAKENCVAGDNEKHRKAGVTGLYPTIEEPQYIDFYDGIVLGRAVSSTTQAMLPYVLALLGGAHCVRF